MGAFRRNGDGKNVKCMVEFGEKLKQARERKGLTQQTVAARMFVTRQVVSRWECGARYPDLLTAKKLADFLEVSLDELLSGEAWECVDQTAPILRTGCAVRIQTLLFGAIFLLSGLFTIAAGGVLLNNWSNPVLWGRLLGYFLCTAALGAGLVLSLRHRLSPGKAGVLMSVYFLSTVLVRLANLGTIWGMGSRGMLACYLVWELGIYLGSAGIVLWFFLSAGRRAAGPVYGVCLGHVLLTVVGYVQQLVVQAGPGWLVSRSAWLLLVAGLMVLLSYQARIHGENWARVQGGRNLDTLVSASSSQKNCKNYEKIPAVLAMYWKFC